MKYSLKFRPVKPVFPHLNGKVERCCAPGILGTAIKLRKIP